MSQKSPAESSAVLSNMYTSMYNLMDAMRNNSTQVSVDRIEGLLCWVVFELAVIGLLLLLCFLALIAFNVYTLVSRGGAGAKRPGAAPATAELTPMMTTAAGSLAGGGGGPSKGSYNDLRKKQMTIAAPGVQQPPANFDDLRNAGGL